MNSEVVNVKVKFIRPEYKNLKEWCEDPSNLYIGRRGIVFVDKVRYPPKDSIFANPFKLKDFFGENSEENSKNSPKENSSQKNSRENSSRELCLEKYREYLIEKIENGTITIDDLKSLKNKKLGCWCVEPENTTIKCHGHILLEIASKYLF